MLNGEDQKYKDLVKVNMVPPSGSNSWEESVGKYVDDTSEIFKEYPLCFVGGYLKKIMHQKYVGTE